MHNDIFTTLVAGNYFLSINNLQWEFCVDRSYMQSNLVGIVKYCNFSKFSDINTNVKLQHVQTCQKKLKKCQSLG